MDGAAMRMPDFAAPMLRGSLSPRIPGASGQRVSGGVTWTWKASLQSVKGFGKTALSTTGKSLGHAVVSKVHE